MSERSSSSSGSEEEEVWYRLDFSNWERSSLGRLRAIRPEGPFHLPVQLFLVRREESGQDRLDSTAEVCPGDTIWDVEWKLGLHRSGISSGQLSCPICVEDLAARGEDLARAGEANRVFSRSTLRVEDVPWYFFENQIFCIIFC